MEARFPDFISIGRYKKWLDNETHETMEGKLVACKALTLHSLQEIKDIPFSIWDIFYKNVTDTLLEKYKYVPLLIKYKGKIIGVNSFRLSTIGEVADIETMLIDGNISDIAKCLLTEVESHSVKDDEWMLYGVDDAGEEIYVVYLVDINIDKNKYVLKEYTIENLLHADMYDDFPIKLYNAIVDFIHGVGIPYFLELSTLYSSDLQEKQQKANHNKLMEELMIAQAGLRQSLILQRLIS